MPWTCWIRSSKLSKLSNCGDQKYQIISSNLDLMDFNFRRKFVIGDNLTVYAGTIFFDLEESVEKNLLFVSRSGNQQQQQRQEQQRQEQQRQEQQRQQRQQWQQRQQQQQHSMSKAPHPTTAPLPLFRNSILAEKIGKVCHWRQFWRCQVTRDWWKLLSC